MNLLARRIAHLLAENANDYSYHEDEIRYGLEIFLGALLQILIFMVIALPLGVGKEVLAIIIPAAIFRRYSDGPHCQAYYRCTITSLVNFIILGYLSRYISVNYFLAYIIFIAIISAIIINYYVPGYNPGNPITDESIKRERRQKCYWVLLFVLLASIMGGYILDEKPVAIALLLGLFWQTITLLPGGYLYIHLWDRFFEKIEGKLRGGEVLKC
jgi:accessory gene regulator B